MVEEAHKLQKERQHARYPKPSASVFTKSREKRESILRSFLHLSLAFLPLLEHFSNLLTNQLPARKSFLSKNNYHVINICSIYRETTRWEESKKGLFRSNPPRVFETISPFSRREQLRRLSVIRKPFPTGTPSPISTLLSLSLSLFLSESTALQWLPLMNVDSPNTLHLFFDWLDRVTWLLTTRVTNTPGINDTLQITSCPSHWTTVHPKIIRNLRDYEGFRIVVKTWWFRKPTSWIGSMLTRAHEYVAP